MRNIQVKPIILGLIALVLLCTYSNAAEVVSPDGRNSIQFSLENTSPYYSVSRDGHPVIAHSALGFEFLNAADLVTGFKIESLTYSSVNEQWQTVWGQFSTISNHYNELHVILQETTGMKRNLEFLFRAYNDGVAFRYILPFVEGWTDFQISSEITRFNLTADHTTWWIINDYDSYEKLYSETPLSQVSGANTPMTMSTADGLYMAIHEADLTDWAGMTLIPDSTQSFSLKCDLVPWPDGVKVKGSTPHRSPWRTIHITETAGELIESSLILNLNEPCRLEDTSWIQPQKYLGIWWGMHIGKYAWDMGNKHGANTQNTMKHIDMAAELKIPALLVEGWNEGWAHWGEADAFDFTTPYADFDLPALVEYGREKGVAIVGHHETGGDVPNYERQLDAAFAYYRDLGISAVKTGYAGMIRPEGQHHHGQWMVNHYRHVVLKAAEYQIMLDAHEPIKPTGISRTWPHMMTREGARGMEWNAWSEGNPPDHTCILPFTRFLGGPMDYTPGIFDLEFKAFKPDNRVHTTLAKQLALYVILYSPLQMAADLPENYLNQPAFRFIQDVPVTWDETRVFDAAIGDYIIMGRRQGSSWYLGAITDEQAREISLKFDFLDTDRIYICNVIEDHPDTHYESNPYQVRIKDFFANTHTTMVFRLAPGGGTAIQLLAVDELPEPPAPEPGPPPVKP